MYGKDRTGYGTAERHDPLRGFNYQVVFTGDISQFRTGFSSVSGIKVQSDFKEYKEGGNNGTAEKIPMDSTYEPIEMSGGMTKEFDLVEAFANQFDRSTGNGHLRKHWTISIYLYDRDGTTLVRHIKLKNAWISRYEEGDYDAMKGEVLIEKIVVQFEGVEISRK